jgi:hypothetical protein
MPAHVDQCSLDPASHEIACAAAGTLTVLRDNPAAAPSVVAQIVTGKSIHTLASDPATGADLGRLGGAAGRRFRPGVPARAVNVAPGAPNFFQPRSHVSHRKRVS